MNSKLEKVTKPKLEKATKLEKVTKPENETKPELDNETKPEPENETKPELDNETKPEPDNETKPELENETKLDNDIKTKLENATKDIPEFSLCGMSLNGKVVELYDGDTCKIILPLNNVFYKFDCRLCGIDTPEIKPSLTKPNREKEIVMAKTARNELLKLICLNNKCLENINITKKKIETTLKENKNLVTVKCLEFDKYGRLLVELYGTNQTKSFNKILVDKNLAVEYDGGTKINPWTCS